MSNLSEKNIGQHNDEVKEGSCSSQRGCSNSSGESGKSTSVEESDKCGSGCCCNFGKSGINQKLKILVCLIVVLVVVGILIYKSSCTKKNISRDSTKEASFAVTQSAPENVPANNSDVSAIMPGKKVEAVNIAAAVAPDKKADVIAVMETKPLAPVADTIQISRKIGESLDSLSSLNKVALNQDTVFVFIPAAKNEFADDATKNAVIAAQRTLKSKNIILGLYTLPASSSDYSGISAQVQTPAILIATKGKGMSAVSGEITETKLLQAYMSSTRAGGCGPASSGCGPASGGCN